MITYILAGIGAAVLATVIYWVLVPEGPNIVRNESIDELDRHLRSVAKFSTRSGAKVVVRSSGRSVSIECRSRCPPTWDVFDLSGGSRRLVGQGSTAETSRLVRVAVFAGDLPEAVAFELHGEIDAGAAYEQFKKIRRDSQ